MTTSKNQIFVIGSSYSGEFGLGHVQELDKLTNVVCHHNITQIYSGYSFAIYTDSETKIILAAGADGYHQCAIGRNDDPTTLTAVTYFQDHNIKINRIFVNVASECSFWKTNNNNVYGAGRNDNGQLGIGNNVFLSEPILIPILQNAIDIQSAEYYSVALCQSYNDELNAIIFHWSRIYNLPNDITNLIVIFSKCFTVYATEYSEYGGNGRPKRDKKDCKFDWAEIETFKDKEIIKIRIGDNHSLFLESNGNLWSCGYNANGELGLGHTNNITEPVVINYFIENNIKIKDIECGSSHCLALSFNDKLYAFGENEYQQCGQNILDVVDTPILIGFFKDMKIERMQCGVNHSYVMTADGKHYLFGRNYDNECIFLDEDTNKVYPPRCIDKIVKEQCMGKILKSISLGYDNTKLILE